MRLSHPLHCGNKKNPTHLEAFYILHDKTKEINKGFESFSFPKREVLSPKRK
jgi:hypothetical protein